MSAAAVAGLAVAGLAAGLVILAVATARGRTEVLPYDAYAARWRELHGLEPHRMARFLGTYYRLPYALARPLARAGVDPNVVTLAGFVLAAATVPAYLAGGRWLSLGGAFVLLAGLADQLDGAVAIASRRETTFGAIWDSAVDRASDLVVLAAPATWLLANVGGRTAAVATAGLAASGATLSVLEFTRARCHAVGYVSGQVVTPGERPTRIVVEGTAGVVAGVVGARAAATLWAVTAWGVTAITAVSVGLLLRDAARRATGDGSPSGRGTPTTPASG